MTFLNQLKFTFEEKKTKITELIITFLNEKN